MATVTGMDAETIDALMGQMVTSVRVDDNGQLIYKSKNGQETNGGPVVSPSLAIDRAYPVGSIYMSTIPTSPADLFDLGTWVRWGKGRVPVSQNDVDTEFNISEEIGGAKTVKLTATEMPSHTHIQNPHTHIQNPHSHGPGARDLYGMFDSPVINEQVGPIGGTDMNMIQTPGAGSGAASTGLTTAVNQSSTAVNQSTGGNGSHNNLQPYIVCYMWKRTN